LKTLFATVGILGLAFCVAAGGPAPAAKPSVSELIGQLGSEDFREREEAAAALAKCGPEALPALRQAAKSDDPEVRLRVAPILVKLERAVLSSDLLAAKKLSLHYKDTPLGTALADLRTRTGLNITFDPEQIKDPFRKVTCVTGELPVWEALEAFCAAAGMREEFRDEIPLAKAQHKAYGYIAYPITPVVGLNEVPVVLVEGKVERLPGDRRTAVRVLALPRSFPGHRVTLGTGETTLCFDITPAPGLKWDDVTAVKITKLIDDADRLGSAGTPKLQDNGLWVPDGGIVLGVPNARLGQFNNLRGYPMPPSNAANPRVRPVPLKLATPAARTIKRLEGSVFGEIVTPNAALVTLNNPAKNTGVAYEGPGGDARLTVVSAEAIDGGDAMSLILEYPAAWMVNMRRGANPGGVWPEAPLQNEVYSVKAYNADGKLIEPGCANPGPRVTPDGSKIQFYMYWTFPTKMGLPAKLVVTGPRSQTVEVPFVLENVPLP
jgi:hypothetical protein